MPDGRRGIRRMGRSSAAARGRQWRTVETHDCWASWLLRRRDGGDPGVRKAALRQLGQWRDEVLAGARLTPGEHLLDVGSGDGLIGFGALDLVGGTGHVTFTDVSRDLLDVCRAAATDLGVLDRCTFIQAPADSLTGIADASVDVVTTRSVLIYVAKKAHAFAEFLRVLAPGGRISLFEPINRHMFPEPAGEFMGYDSTGVEDLVARIRCAGVPQGDSDPTTPMLDFDDGALVELAEAAGFVDIELVLRRQVRVESRPRSWESFLASSPNPLAPTWDEIIATSLSANERERFAALMKPRVEEGTRRVRLAVATLTAVRPPALAAPSIVEAAPGLGHDRGDGGDRWRNQCRA